MAIVFPPLISIVYGFYILWPYDVGRVLINDNKILNKFVYFVWFKKDFYNVKIYIFCLCCCCCCYYIKNKFVLFCCRTALFRKDDKFKPLKCIHIATFLECKCSCYEKKSPYQFSFLAFFAHTHNTLTTANTYLHKYTTTHSCIQSCCLNVWVSVCVFVTFIHNICMFLNIKMHVINYLH